MPLSFEANQGQTDKQVKFFSRGQSYSLFLTSTEAVLQLRKADSELQNEKPGASSAKSASPQATVLRMQFVGANPLPQVAGQEELPGKSNYFLGNDSKQWRTNVSTYAKVKYEAVYPGVDLVYYGNQRQLEYDFIVAPGADPKTIQLAFEGADELSVNAHGDLVLHTGGGEVRLRKPSVYQEIDGVKHAIPGTYVLLDPETPDSRLQTQKVGFQVAAYDTSRSLVIDPVLVYSTFLGGSDQERAYGIAVDAAGNAYVTGGTYSLDFPATVGAFDTTHNGGGCCPVDIFITKLNPTGDQLVYSTFLGGSSGGDEGRGIALDAAGNAYVTGNGSPGFPTTPGAFDTVGVGGAGAFVTKLNATGDQLVYSTFLGSAAARAIAVDAAGSAYVTGFTDSTIFPTTVGAFDTTFNGGGSDFFITKLTAAGDQLVYSTFLGGSGFEEMFGNNIAIDAAGNAYVTAQTPSADFPTTAGAFDTTFNGGLVDAFVTKLNATGDQLVYSTFLGGSLAGDTGFGIAADTSGNAYVAGKTSSTDFPITVGAFDTTYNGSSDAFVTKCLSE